MLRRASEKTFGMRARVSRRRPPRPPACWRARGRPDPRRCPAKPWSRELIAAASAPPGSAAPRAGRPGSARAGARGLRTYGRRNASPRLDARRGRARSRQSSNAAPRRASRKRHRGTRGTPPLGARRGSRRKRSRSSVASAPPATRRHPGVRQALEDAALPLHAFDRKPPTFFRIIQEEADDLARPPPLRLAEFRDRPPAPALAGQQDARAPGDVDLPQEPADF